MTDSTNTATVDARRLRAFIARIERLNEEEAALKSDKREVFAEARADGYDPRIMRRVIAARQADPDDRADEDALFDTYMRALSQGGPDERRPPHARDARDAREAPATEIPAAARPVEPAPATDRPPAERAAKRPAGRADGDLDLPAFLRRGDPACVVPVPAGERGG